MYGKITQSVSQRASSLLGVAQSYVAGRENKLGALLLQFAEGAIDEVYLACDWPFGIEALTKAQLSQLTATRIDGNHLKLDNDNYARLLAISPSNTNWSLVNGSITLRVAEVLPGKNDLNNPDTLADLCLAPSIPELLVGYKTNATPEAYHHHFINLSAQCLATQIAYGMYNDSVYADSMRKQYMVALKDAKNLYSYQLNIDNASKVI